MHSVGKDKHGIEALLPSAARMRGHALHLLSAGFWRPGVNEAYHVVLNDSSEVRDVFCADEVYSGECDREVGSG